MKSPRLWKTSDVEEIEIVFPGSGAKLRVSTDDLALLGGEINSFFAGDYETVDKWRDIFNEEEGLVILDMDGFRNDPGLNGRALMDRDEFKMRAALCTSNAALPIERRKNFAG